MDIQSLYNIFQQFPVICTDTRNIAPNSIFVALKGANFNGNAFATNALQQGAAYAIIDEAKYATDDRLILVEDALKTLQDLAHHHRQQFQIPFIGITGTNGKTTTKELIHAVLSSTFKTVATKGNLNNHIGVPLTILSIPKDTEMAIIEMGANHQYEIEGYCKVANPNFAIINNVGKAHLEGFGSLEGVKKAKGELYDYIRENNGTLFINNDLEYLIEMSTGIDSRISYGTNAPVDILGKVINEGTFLKFAILNHLNETIIATQLVGHYNFPNALAAVAVGLHFGIDIDTISVALENYTPSNSRSQLIKSESNEIILDAYNANPTSMKMAIENMIDIKSTKQKYLLLGAMKELGTTSIEEHQMLIDKLVAAKLKNVILVGTEFSSLQNPFPSFENITLAIEFIKSNPIIEAIILVKGSNSIHMDKIVPYL